MKRNDFTIPLITFYLMCKLTIRCILNYLFRCLSSVSVLPLHQHQPKTLHKRRGFLKPSLLTLFHCYLVCYSSILREDSVIMVLLKLRIILGFSRWIGQLLVDLVLNHLLLHQKEKFMLLMLLTLVSKSICLSLNRIFCAKSTETFKQGLSKGTASNLIFELLYPILGILFHNLGG